MAPPLAGPLPFVGDFGFKNPGDHIDHAITLYLIE